VRDPCAIRARSRKEVPTENVRRGPVGLRNYLGIEVDG